MEFSRQNRSCVNETKPICFFLLGAIILSAFLGSYACKASWVSKKNKIIRVDLRFEQPYYLKGQPQIIKHFIDTTSVYYYNNYVIFLITSREMFGEDGVTKSIESRYHPFVYRQNETKGLLFGSFADTANPGCFGVDSILRRGGYNRNIKANSDTLVAEKFYFDNKQLLVSRYVTSDVSDENMYDTVVFYFDKRMNDLPYSFSKYYDSIEQMKLYKVEVIYKARISETGREVIPASRFMYCMTRSSSTTPDSLRLKMDMLIDRFKKHSD